MNHSNLSSSLPNYAQRELTRRAILQTNENTAQLRKSIERFGKRSDTFSSKIVMLTWVLIVLALLSLTFPVLASWKF